MSPEIAAKVLRSDTASDVPRRATLEATPDTFDKCVVFMPATVVTFDAMLATLVTSYDIPATVVTLLAIPATVVTFALIFSTAATSLEIPATAVTSLAMPATVVTLA